MRRILLGVCVTLILCGSAPAQQAQQGSGEQGLTSDSYLQLLRTDLRARKTKLITATLNLDEATGKRFWPLQREYENESETVNDKRLDTLKRYADHWDSLTDAEAKDLGHRMFEFQEERLKVRRKYFDKMSKEVSPIVAAKYFQVETLLENLVDVQVASQFPLINTKE